MVTAILALLSALVPSIDNVLILRLTHDHPPAIQASTDDLASTGNSALDRKLAELGSPRIEQVFRHPPRGWASEEGARVAKLDRWIRLTWRHSPGELEKVRQILLALDAVEIAEKRGALHLADTVPNDPEAPSQWAWDRPFLNAYSAWDRITDTNQVVAVIDTGTDLKHDDLEANQWKNTGEIRNNGIDDDLNGFIDDRLGYDFYYGDHRPDDVWGHGVHVAGTVGAHTDNDLQVAGVCWSVPVMSVKVFSDTGVGGSDIGAAGMVYAADNGASVSNMSWGTPGIFQVLQDAATYAAELDVVQVAAALNFGVDRQHYPAGYDEVMGIIATNNLDERPPWSNHGDWCSMAAPGAEILSTWLRGTTRILEGTSMASPHVAGAAALLRELNPSLDRIDIQHTLEYSADDLGDDGFDPNFGWGRLDLASAVHRAETLSIASTTVAPGSSVSLPLSFPSEAGFLHVLLPSRVGRTPGLPLTGYDPQDLRQLPLNEDSLLFDFLLSRPDGAGIFVEFIATLDGNGKNTATFFVPGGNLLVGEEFSFAALTFDPNALSQISSVSCSVHCHIE